MRRKVWESTPRSANPNGAHNRAEITPICPRKPQIELKKELIKNPAIRKCRLRTTERPSRAIQRRRNRRTERETLRHSRQALCEKMNAAEGAPHLSHLAAFYGKARFVDISLQNIGIISRCCAHWTGAIIVACLGGDDDVPLDVPFSNPRLCTRSLGRYIYGFVVYHYRRWAFHRVSDIYCGWIITVDAMFSDVKMVAPDEYEIE